MSIYLNVEILTLFPEMFPGVLGFSLSGSALSKGLWSYNIVNIRDFGIGAHQQVDDTQFGGGSGMVIRPDVLGPAIEKSILNQKGKKNIYYLSPRGFPINNEVIDEILTKKDIILICGRYEGIDERVIEEYNAIEICVGDVVLSGGEPAAQLLLDACIRKVPGVLDNPHSLIEESFGNIADGLTLLEYPLYTKPRLWKSRQVPDVLLSGHHKQIGEWRSKQAFEETKKRRPELLNKGVENECN
jgi:tRNA (guanine37-N1)-methyltransferase